MNLSMRKKLQESNPFLADEILRFERDSLLADPQFNMAILKKKDGRAYYQLRIKWPQDLIKDVILLKHIGSVKLFDGISKEELDKLFKVEVIKFLEEKKNKGELLY